MEFEIDGTGEAIANAAIDDNREGESMEPDYRQDEGDNVPQDSSGITIPFAIPTVSVAAVEEPYVGQEFESESAAHAFYNAYATEVGFIVRVSKLSRSRRDGTAIGRALVCNKEGFRMPDKREKIVRQRAETRVGCRAMIMVRKVSSGKWVVTKLVKEHTHPLTPGKGRRDFVYEQYPVSFCSFTALQLYTQHPFSDPFYATTYLFIFVPFFRMNTTKFGNYLSSWQLRKNDLQPIKGILN